LDDFEVFCLKDNPKKIFK